MVIAESEHLAKFPKCRKLDAILGPINCRTEAPSPSVKWGEFVRNTYLPFYKRKWKRSTAECNEHRLKFYLSPLYAERTLGSFKRDELQDMLDKKAQSGLSYSIVAHLRWKML